MSLELVTIMKLSLERQKLREALADLQGFWDRREEHGWTARDTERLAEIKVLAEGN